MPFIHEIKLQFIPSFGGLVSGFDCNTKDLWQYTLKWYRQVDQSISASVRRLSVTCQLPPVAVNVARLGENVRLTKTLMHETVRSENIQPWHI